MISCGSFKGAVRVNVECTKKEHLRHIDEGGNSQGAENNLGGVEKTNFLFRINHF